VFVMRGSWVQLLGEETLNAGEAVIVPNHVHDSNQQHSPSLCGTTRLRDFCGMTNWLTSPYGAPASRPSSFSNVVGMVQEGQVVAGLLRDSVVLCRALG